MAPECEANEGQQPATDRTEVCFQTNARINITLWDRKKKRLQRFGFEPLSHRLPLRPLPIPTRSSTREKERKGIHSLPGPIGDVVSVLEQQPSSQK